MVSEEEMVKALVAYGKEHGKLTEAAEEHCFHPNKWQIGQEDGRHGSICIVTEDGDKRSISASTKLGWATVDYVPEEEASVLTMPFGEVYYHSSNANRLKATYDKWIN
jgi:hypothetical protein